VLLHFQQPWPLLLLFQKEYLTAWGCGANTIASLAFTAIKALNITVEVRLVLGIIAAITP